MMSRLSPTKRPGRRLSWRSAMIVIAILLALGIGVIAVIQWLGRTSGVAPSLPAQGENPLAGVKLYVDPHSPAARQAQDWQTSRPGEAAKLRELAALPTAKWLTSSENLKTLDAYLRGAGQAGAVPVLVAYNLPLRDCGRYSGGGAASAGAYQQFIQRLAQEIGNRAVVVILEPDALAGIDGLDSHGAPCLKAADQAMYYDLLKAAVRELSALSHTLVYVDAGNSAWVQDIAVMATRLRQAGLDQADGFSLNVSNFQPLDSTLSYGRALAGQLAGKHFVVDTSRNGLGAYTNTAFPDYNWCNPPGRALGHSPTTTTGQAGVDAYLYIKYPGESDGQDDNPRKCFGGPAAGTWWPDYALGLLERWPSSLKAQ